jgi:hypothetical protein
MGWRSGEVWLDADVLWFREQQRAPAFAAAVAVELPRFGPAETGLDASRRRRLAAQTARRRRLATRTVPAVALVIGSASMLSVGAFRSRAGGHEVGPLLEDPPSLTFRADDFGFHLPEPSRDAPSVEEPQRVEVEWRTATSIGLQYAGRLVDGTQLPVEGPNWLTWNPATDSSPNLPGRLYGNERTIRALLSVLAGYRRANPEAPRVVVGDISFLHGGPMDQHVSHQNGLDVDVYYPRRDGRATAPVTGQQIDRELSQDLLDRFLAAGAKIVFVGFSSGLHGPSGIVVPYPNHANHMHVRFALPR